MRSCAVLGALLLGGCASATAVPEPAPAPAPVGPPERTRSAGCSASSAPAARLVAGRRRVAAGPVDVLLPARPRAAARFGGLEVPLLVRPGRGRVELRLATAFVAGWAPAPREPPVEGPLPADAARTLRLERCPPVPRARRELGGDPAVAYAGWIALARDACVPLDVTDERGRRVRVRLSLGRACAPPG